MKKLLTLLLVTISFNLMSIDPPYILYVEGAPGVCQYWFYDIDGTIIPLLEHQIKNNQYKRYRVVRKPYKNNGY